LVLKYTVYIHKCIKIRLTQLITECTYSVDSTTIVRTVEPRFNEVARNRSNLFVKSRVRYIENLDITNLRGNEQNVRCIEVIVNNWFVNTQFNAIFVTQKCRVLRCNSLSMVAFSINYSHFWADTQLLFTKERHFQSSDLKMLQHRGYTENCLCKQGNTVIRYIEVDFTFGLPDYVRYIEEFVISKNSLYRGSLYRGSIPYILL